LHAVSFLATINQPYYKNLAAAEKLRLLALPEYHCVDFMSFTKEAEKIAISWLESMGHIKAWKITLSIALPRRKAGYYGAAM